MIDISAVGSKITIEFASDPKTVEITEFSDEGSPFQCNDVDLSQNNKNLNGTMISSRQVQVYHVGVTVIPGSDADKKLFAHAQKASLQPGNKTAIKDLIVKQMTVAIPETYFGDVTTNTTSNSSNTDSETLRLFKFTNGRMKAGAIGPAASAQGRLGARNYSFEFEGYGLSNSKTSSSSSSSL